MPDGSSIETKDISEVSKVHESVLLEAKASQPENNPQANDQVAIDEETQRRRSVELAKAYFTRQDVEDTPAQIAREADPKVRARMLKGFCTRTNGALMDIENSVFGAAVKVQLEGVEHETAIDWQPPRPMDDIFDEYFEEVGNLLHTGNNREAASVLFQAIEFGHAYPDGNGRTGRLLFLHLLNPQITTDMPFIEWYMQDEDIRAESRVTCNDILMDAVSLLRQKANITDVPFVMIGDRIRSGGASNELLRMAYKQLHPLNTPFVVHLDTLPEEQTKQLRNRQTKLSRDTLREILHSPKARIRTFEGMWQKQAK